MTDAEGEVMVKPLEWDELGNGHAYRAKAPLFGSIRLETYYSGGFHVLWSVPGFCDSFTQGLYPTPEAAKAAAQADYAARILSAIDITTLVAERDALQKALADADSYIDKGHFQMARNITRAALKGAKP